MSDIQITKEALKEKRKEYFTLKKEYEKQETSKRIEEFKELVGRCYMSKNSYGEDESWWTYYKIIDISENDLYLVNDSEVFSSCTAIRFEKDCYGAFSINLKESVYTHSLDVEISEDSFNKAWEEIKESVNSICL